MGWVYSSGQGLWEDYKNEETGEHTVKEHVPKVVWKSCKQGEHAFEFYGNRELKCKKCGIIAQYVPGRDNEFLSKNGLN